MYNYNICNEADEDIFARQCTAIEKHISPLEKEPLLTDVDGTMIQRYRQNDVQIKVTNDIQVNAVYVESSEDIKHFFS